MPAYRNKSKYRCAGHVEEAQACKVSKRKALKEDLSDSEKDKAELNKLVRKTIKQKKKEWEATLLLWNPPAGFRFPVNTVAMYKSDAKSAYFLTEKNTLTLRHESISHSTTKTFFSHEDVVALFDKNLEAEAYMLDRDKESIVLRAFRKVNRSNASCRKNFQEIEGCINPHLWRH